MTRKEAESLEKLCKDYNIRCNISEPNDYDYYTIIFGNYDIILTNYENAHTLIKAFIFNKNY